MFMILAENTTTTIQNVYTPFPLTMHIIFCVLATVVYGLEFISKKSLHYMLLLIACDLTFVTQINTAKPTIIGLFFAELFLLIGAGFFSYKYNKKLKAEEGEKKKAPKQDGDAVDKAFED